MWPRLWDGSKRLHKFYDAEHVHVSARPWYSFSLIICLKTLRGPGRTGQSKFPPHPMGANLKLVSLVVGSMCGCEAINVTLSTGVFRGIPNRLD